MAFEKINGDVIVTLPTLLCTHPEEMINRTKFDVNTPGSFGGVKTDRHTELLFVY